MQLYNLQGISKVQLSEDTHYLKFKKKSNWQICTSFVSRATSYNLHHHSRPGFYSPFRCLQYSRFPHSIKKSLTQPRTNQHSPAYKVNKLTCELQYKGTGRTVAEVQYLKNWNPHNKNVPSYFRLFETSKFFNEWGKKKVWYYSNCRSRRHLQWGCREC